MRLTDEAADVYSQFGEDGIIQHIFEVIETRSKVCVEFGAGASADCSNVANLWKHDWVAYLIEADPDKANALRRDVNRNCFVFERTVRPSGIHSIDNILGVRDVDLMVIDIDGNDYLVWEHMTLKPRVMCIEFNPTIPSHIVLYQEDDSGMAFGASLRALINLAHAKEYYFIGATSCNAFFVLNDLADPFFHYETDPEVLFPLVNNTFLVTDFDGHAMAVGKEQPWRFKVPYIGAPILGDTVRPITSVFIRAEQTMNAYEDRYGKGVRWVGRPNVANPDENPCAIPNGRAKLLTHFAEKPPLICIDITDVSSFDDVQWVYPMAQEYGYHCRRDGDIIALIRSDF